MRLSCLTCVVLVLALCGGPVWAGDISHSEHTDLVHAPNNTDHTWNYYSRSGVRIETFSSGHSAKYKVQCNSGSWEVYSATGICHLAKSQTCYKYKWTINGCSYCSKTNPTTGACTKTTKYSCYIYKGVHETCTRPQVNANPPAFSENRRTCSVWGQSPSTVIRKSTVRPGNNALFCAGSISDPNPGSTDIEGHAVGAEIVGKPPYAPLFDDMIALAPWADGFLEAASLYSGGGRQPYWIARRDGGQKARHYLMIPTKPQGYDGFLGSTAVHTERACYRAKPSATCPGQPDCCTDLSLGPC